ncbi:MAG: hypothetical protein SGJ24_05900 [Chloroflexota bacterium]|nr:hypothetical protein [Chloroflexota bacterium]
MKMPTQIDPTRISDLLGSWTARLIDLVTSQAQLSGLSVFIVGGVVRDLLLARPNYDLDFAIEGDAITFADSLATQFGGSVTRYPPFGTAKWLLDINALPLGADAPDVPIAHLDFAMTRTEYYTHPGALPRVQSAGITSDLARRDFTINTLAFQVSPTYGALLDPFGGADDVRAGIVRVLHDRSFIDDPTRIVRAVRFESRLGFQIETHTRTLMDAARVRISQVTGERLRNELSLMLGEPDPAGAFLSMQKRGFLNAIHPAWRVDEALDRQLTAIGTITSRPGRMAGAAPIDPVDAMWVAILSTLPLPDLRAVGERLLFSKAVIATAESLHHLRADLPLLRDRAAPDSVFTARLDNVPELALVCAWALFDDTMIQERISHFFTTWRTLRPIANGDTLRAMGLRPGRCFSVILDRLRAAWIDGIIVSAADETQLIETLIAAGVCDE